MTLQPSASALYRQFRPSYASATYYTAQCAGLTGLGVWLSIQASWLLWMAGQFLLTLTFVQWFVLMHEAGHHTLFPARWMNHFVGHIASVFTVIPFRCWYQVHDRHHQWTGWQDLDSTTASLVPRPLGAVERRLMNFAWKFWIPIFSIVYRVQNYYNLFRIKHYIPRHGHLLWMGANIAGLMGFYALVVALAGWERCLVLFGAARLLALGIEDPLLLSQHTHMPTRWSGGDKVRPVPALQQAAYTRSLVFPRWISRFWLIHFDAHELHHMYVKVPGYYLDRIDFRPPNAVRWWAWLKGAKSLSGEAFLFATREQTGFRL